MASKKSSWSNYWKRLIYTLILVALCVGASLTFSFLIILHSAKFIATLYEGDLFVGRLTAGTTELAYLTIPFIAVMLGMYDLEKHKITNKSVSAIKWTLFIISIFPVAFISSGNAIKEFSGIVSNTSPPEPIKPAALITLSDKRDRLVDQIKPLEASIKIAYREYKVYDDPYQKQIAEGADQTTPAFKLLKKNRNNYRWVWLQEKKKLTAVQSDIKHAEEAMVTLQGGYDQSYRQWQQDVLKFNQQDRKGWIDIITNLAIIAWSLFQVIGIQFANGWLIIKAGHLLILFSRETDEIMEEEHEEEKKGEEKEVTPVETVEVKPSPLPVVNEAPPPPIPAKDPESLPEPEIQQKPVIPKVSTNLVAHDVSTSIPSSEEIAPLEEDEIENIDETEKDENSHLQLREELDKAIQILDEATDKKVEEPDRTEEIEQLKQEVEDLEEQNRLAEKQSNPEIPDPEEPEPPGWELLSAPPEVEEIQYKLPNLNRKPRFEGSIAGVNVHEVLTEIKSPEGKVNGEKTLDVDPGEDLMVSPLDVDLSQDSGKGPLLTDEELYAHVDKEVPIDSLTKEHDESHVIPFKK